MGAESPAIAQAQSRLDRRRNKGIRAERGGALKLATEQQAGRDGKTCCTCVIWTLNGTVGVAMRARVLYVD